MKTSEKKYRQYEITSKSRKIVLFPNFPPSFPPIQCTTTQRLNSQDADEKREEKKHEKIKKMAMKTCCSSRKMLILPQTKTNFFPFFMAFLTFH